MIELDSRPPLTALLLLSLLASACGGGSAGNSGNGTSAAATSSPPAAPSGPDTTAPAISTLSPGIDETGVIITANLVISFSEPLNESTIDDQSLLLTDQGVPVPGAVTYDSTGNRLSFTPDSPLSTNTVYGVMIANTLDDIAGNSFLGQSWFFTTGDSYNLGGTSQITIDQCMNDGDKLMLTLVNNARGMNRSCGTQQVTPQAPLGWNCFLDQAAIGHSTSMADNDFHEHISPIDGSDPGDRVIAAGYDPQAWAENIAAGYQTEEAVMSAWLASPEHCSNIMETAFTEMGAGFAENAGSTFGIYWTQNFGRPRN